MKLSKTPLALALALSLAAPMAMATDNPKHTHEAEEMGRHADADRPDVLLLTKVKSKLAMDDSISALDINVDVENSVVFLRGTVETQEQANEAVRLARDTVGVSSVKSHLVVNPQATGEQKSRNMESPEDRDRGEVDRNRSSTEQTRNRHRDESHRNGDDAQRPDALLLAKVKSKLAASDSVSALDINVDVDDGRVSLRGTVDNQAQANEAVRLARETVGVNTVQSHLVVNANGQRNDGTRSMMVGVPSDRTQTQTDHSRDKARNDDRNSRAVDRNADGEVDRPIDRPDAWVLTKVKSQMLASDTVGALDINVDVDDGVVTLNGQVASRAEAQEAERIARGTEGVKQVKSNLRVTGN